MVVDKEVIILEHANLKRNNIVHAFFTQGWKKQHKQNELFYLYF